MSSGPIRYHGPWKFHKRLSEPDRWLDEMGFYRKHTARDPSCLFRAVSENVYNTQRYFHKVRMECVKFMATNTHLFEGSLNCPIEDYLKEMSNPSEWGGFIEISAMSHLYRRDFVIYEANQGPITKICNGYGKVIHLFHSPDNKHFDVVYTKDFINISSYCQSVVYEILYDGVYQMKNLPYAIEKMLYDKLPTNHIEYFMSKRQKERSKTLIEASEDDKDKNNNAVALKCKHHKDLERTSLLKESLSIYVFNRSLIQLENVCMNCLNVNSAKDLIDNGITPFPYKVAKALDPDTYRNIEFDVWNELRRELRYGPKYSDGTTLQVGVKCLCKLQPDQPVPYRCHIQEMTQGGPCLVFIEDLGEKRVVNYDQLEPLPLEEIRPWAPPYRYSRTNSQFLTLSQMFQQIGTITRKQSLGKAKPKSDSEQPKSPEKVPKTKISWSEVDEDTDLCFPNESPEYSTCQHLDYVNFEPGPVEVFALPLMVDGRAGSGGAPPDMPPHPSQQQNPPANNDNHHNQAGGSGDMGAHGVSSPASVRASTPASTNNTLNTYTGGMTAPVGGGSTPGGVMTPAPVAYSMPGGCAPYMCGVKSVVWCAPHSPPPTGPMPVGGMAVGIGGVGVGPPQPPPHGIPPLAPLAPLPPPPHGVNPHVFKSVQANGADLPMNDIPTLRYYFNLGVECLWAAYGPPPHHPPPRHYSPRDLSQDMQQMSLHDRGGMNQNCGEQGQKQKPPLNDKPPLGKGNSQRPLVGPRFKRGGGNQDGNQNSNQGKGHNNNMVGNKGPHNRRNSHTENRGNPAHGHYGGGGGGGEGECVIEQPMLTLPYIPYPPPVYPIQYYPVEADPAMMGMMGGMGFMGYDEGVGMEYGGMQPYFAPHGPYPHHPPAHAQHPQHPPAHHVEHK